MLDSALHSARIQLQSDSRHPLYSAVVSVNAPNFQSLVTVLPCQFNHPLTCIFSLPFLVLNEASIRGASVLPSAFEIINHTSPTLHVWQPGWEATSGFPSPTSHDVIAPWLSLKDGADGSFCPSRSHFHSVTNKHTEAYINYILFGLLAQTYY